ncbi:MAG: prepilin-type N-terminal cleavage/methylation domain-containing protein [Candidatus Gracilibacteria bacterium]|nr:prepilin-type N-terminal cleavage/methylation domain-containing protein [Candidatus Gracilibacteria bacterium]
MINNKGFSIIEILIGIMIFTLGITGVYVLMVSTINLNEYSKNSIIATNLARGSIEDIRNLRDNNYKNLYKRDKLPGNDTNLVFSTGVYYKVENDYSPFTSETVKLEVILDFAEGKEFLANKMNNYILCLDNENKYTYDCSGQNKKTYFYKYMKFDDVIYNSGGVNKIISGSLKLTSKVIWYNKGYHQIELKTILTDYLRQ